MINRLLILLIGIAFVGCDTSNNPEIGEPKFDEDGNPMYFVRCLDTIPSEGSILFDSYCEQFYHTGELMVTFTCKEQEDNRKFGVCKYYYKSGQLKDSCLYSDNLKVGLYASFYENGNKKERSYYSILDYKKYLNQYVEYDSITGEINPESCYFYNFNFKSKGANDSVSIEFIFNCPMYNDSVFLEFGKFDEVFNISDEDKKLTKIIPVLNQELNFKTYAGEGEGDNELVGIIHDFYIEGDSIKERKYYFREWY